MSKGPFPARRVAIVLVGVLLLLGCGGSDDGDTGSGAETTAAPGGNDTTATTQLITVPVDDLSANHVNPPVSYPNSPSIGGDHYQFWQNCGFYEVEVIEGAATHTLEHGAVWITYNADLLSADEIQQLRALSETNPKLLVSPYDHPETLVLSAWGAQLRTDFRPAAQEIADFIDERVDNPELPEAGVTCQDAAGVPPDDVRTLGDGSTVPDEFLG